MISAFCGKVGIPACCPSEWGPPPPAGLVPGHRPGTKVSRFATGLKRECLPLAHWETGGERLKPSLRTLWGPHPVLRLAGQQPEAVGEQD